MTEYNTRPPHTNKSHGLCEYMKEVKTYPKSHVWTFYMSAFHKHVEKRTNPGMKIK